MDIATKGLVHKLQAPSLPKCEYYKKCQPQTCVLPSGMGPNLGVKLYDKLRLVWYMSAFDQYTLIVSLLTWRLSWLCCWSLCLDMEFSWLACCTQTTDQSGTYCLRLLSVHICSYLENLVLKATNVSFDLHNSINVAISWWISNLYIINMLLLLFIVKQNMKKVSMRK